MALAIRRIVQAMINAEFSDGLGMTSSLDELVYLDTPDKLRQGLLKAQEHIEFIICGDVSQLRLEQVDESVEDSPKREIARACKQLFSMKAPHGKRRWGVAITPAIERMLREKTQQLIKGLLDQAERACRYYRQSNFTELSFARFVGHLVSAAIQILPSNKKELARISNQIWIKRERDKSFPSNCNQKTKDLFQRYFTKTMNELCFDHEEIPISSLTTLEPSGMARIQLAHWDKSFLKKGNVTSIMQQAAFTAFVNMQKMERGRNDAESEYLHGVIHDIIEDVEITHYWIDLLNKNFKAYQQITCHDWSRLKGISTKKVDELIRELSGYIQGSNAVELRLAMLRLLLPLLEPWVLCILVERKLKKESITRHISSGLRELKQHIEYAQPDLLETFNQLKQFARPYRKGNTNGK